MKGIIIFLFAFISTAQAQTYTTAQLSVYLRSQWKTNDSFRIKQAIKDVRDDERNVKIDSLLQRTALLFSQNDVLNQTTKLLGKRFDSAASYYNQNQFSYDSVTKTISIRPDAFVIVPKDVVQFGFVGGAPTPKVGNEDLIWQLESMEKLVDDREKIIDKLQKKIKEQQKIIDKLKK